MTYSTVQCIVTLIPNNSYFGFLVLDPVSLVYHHIPPTELLESRLLLQNHLVRCNYHIPFTGEYLLTNDTGLCDK